MKVLALDLSSSCTGWAVFTDGGLTAYGSLDHDKKILDFGPYPFCYLDALGNMADKVAGVVDDYEPDIIVIEEVNKARARYTQKAIEFCHAFVLQRLRTGGYNSSNVKYISTGVWRRAVGIELTKDQKKQNARLSKAKSAARVLGKKVDKKALGIVGKVSKKHIAVQFVNRTFQLELKQKDNDTSEAICLGLAFISGAQLCDGK